MQLKCVTGNGDSVSVRDNQSSDSNNNNPINNNPRKKGHHHDDDVDVDVDVDVDAPLGCDVSTLCGLVSSTRAPNDAVRLPKALARSLPCLLPPSIKAILLEAV